MDDPVLQVLSRGVFILVFCLTLLDFLHWRDLPRLEVAALFGGFALIIILQFITDLTPITLPDWVTNSGVLAFLTQPYLLLRLLAQFRTVPRLQEAVAVLGLIVSWVLILAFGSTLPIWGTLAIVVAFTYVEGYATVQFVRTALLTRGLS